MTNDKHDEDQDTTQEKESPMYFQHPYIGKSHMYSGRLPDRRTVNMSLAEILSYYNSSGDSFHFYLFLRDGTQLSILREKHEFISIAQIVNGNLTFGPIFKDHPNYDSYGEMTLDILNLPDFIVEWQGGYS